MLSTIATTTLVAAPLLPDLVSVASVEDGYMYGGEFDLLSEPGRVLYRFDAALANLGDGPLQVVETHDLGQATQDIFQEILDTNGSFETQLMETFAYEPPPFGLLQLAALARYNLLEVAPGGEPGLVVATHDKTSHAVVDSVAIDTSLPAAPASPFYQNAFTNPLGISVGYADLYGRNVDQQRLDLTGVPSGQYWLEVIVDPNGYVQETDDTNNTTSILVDLTIPTTGDNDQDGDVDGADFLIWQRDGSPNGVTTSDLADWQDAYGATFAPQILASSAEIPEPASLVLACGALAWLLASTRMPYEVGRM